MIDSVNTQNLRFYCKLIFFKQFLGTSAAMQEMLLSALAKQIVKYLYE